MYKGALTILIALLTLIGVALETGPVTAVLACIVVMYIGFNERRRQITNKVLEQIRDYLFN